MPSTDPATAAARSGGRGRPASLSAPSARELALGFAAGPGSRGVFAQTRLQPLVVLDESTSSPSGDASRPDE